MESNPKELEPFVKAHKIKQKEKDEVVWSICGNYIVSAVSVAVEHVLSGRKAKLEYLKEPVLSKVLENDGLTEEQIYEKEVRKALLAEEMWIKEGQKRGLPETVI